LLAFSFIVTSLVSGLVYGWPNLRRNLIQEGTSLTENELGAIFTVGSWSTQGGRFLTGIARDRFWGTRRTAAFCVASAAGGIVGLAFAGKNDSMVFAISLFLVGLGSGAQLCVQPVAGLFDDRFHGTILASLSGAFQISGLVFLVLMTFTIDRRKSLGSFAIFLFSLALVAVKVLPKKNFSKKSEEVSRDVEEVQVVDTEVERHEHSKQGILSNVSRSEDGDTSKPMEMDEDPDKNGANGAIVDTNEGSSENPINVSSEYIGNAGNKSQDKELLDLIKTWEYVLLVLWFSVELIPLQYYVAAIGFQLERMGDDSGFYTSMFSIIYASSALFAPLLGKIADFFGVACGQALATILSSLSLFILSFEESIPLDGHIAGMACYGIGRMMIFGMFFTNVGKRFGYTHFGTLAGLGLIISALFSLFQYPLIASAAAGNEKVVNIACGTIMLVLGLPYCFWLIQRERNDHKKPQVSN